MAETLPGCSKWQAAFPCPRWLLGNSRYIPGTEWGFPKRRLNEWMDAGWELSLVVGFSSLSVNISRDSHHERACTIVTCSYRGGRARLDAAGDHPLDSVVLDPCRMGNHGPDKLRVDTKERGGAWAVQKVEQHLPWMEQHRGSEGETGKVTGSSHWQRRLGAWGQQHCGRQLWADVQDSICQPFTPVCSGLPRLLLSLFKDRP